MSIEGVSDIENQSEEPSVVIEEGYEDFIPEEFKDSPFEYIKNNGRRIKKGEVEYKEDGLTVREDPTAVLDLPPWKNSSGEVLDTVVKIVNPEKSQIAKSGNPFYEYDVMKIVKKLGFSSPALIAKIKQGDKFAFVMEKAKGYRLVGDDLEELKERLTQEEINVLKPQAENMMFDIQRKLEEFGIYRTVKLTDMIVDIVFSDSESPRIIGLTPIDWERTRIDEEILSSRIKNVHSF